MEATDLLPLLEQLDDNVDDLEEVLEPFLSSSLAKSSKTLPVMDKAKLHVLITYTLESLIFSYLRLRGVDAKQHPVFRELTRVKQYFEKIKALETEPEQRPMTLDKEAAGRFIRHGLAGNDKLDLERAAQQAKERARAQVKAGLLARKASGTPRDSSLQTESPSSGGALEAQSVDDDSDDDDENEEDDDPPDDMEIETERASQPVSYPSGGAESGKKKRKAEEENAKARSKEAKLAKKMKKRPKTDRKNMAKERRRKKEEVRKAQQAE